MNNIVFSEKDCTYVRSFWDNNLSISGEEYTVSKKGDDTLVVRHDAKGGCINYSNDSLLKFVLNRVHDYGITSISLNSVKLMKYSAGDYFAPHRDYVKYDKGTVYTTAIIQLSKDSEYEGGTLIVNNNPQTRTQGSLILFNSGELHEVTKLTRGERYALVLFLFKEDLNLPKTLL